LKYQQQTGPRFTLYASSLTVGGIFTHISLTFHTLVPTLYECLPDTSAPSSSLQLDSCAMSSTLFHESLAEGVRVAGTLNTIPRAFLNKHQSSDFPRTIKPDILLLFDGQPFGSKTVSGSKVVTSRCTATPRSMASSYVPKNMPTAQQHDPLQNYLPECYAGISRNSLAFQPLLRPRIFKRCPLPHPAHRPQAGKSNSSL
jgi:hypothetical protein